MSYPNIRFFFLALVISLFSLLSAQEAPSQEAPKAEEQVQPAEPKAEEQVPEQPAEVKPAEPEQPAEAKPAEPEQPAETKPAEPEQPAEAKPAEPEQQAETKPAETEQPAAESAAVAEQDQQNEASTQNEADKEESFGSVSKVREIEKTFWKGEIANIGSNEIISPYNSAGVAAGVKFIDKELYLVIDPKLSMNFKKIGHVGEQDLDLIFGIHAPLNVVLVSTDISNNDKGVHFKKEDWDEWQDYLKILRYIKIGNSEDNFYFSIGSNLAETIGHGTILRRYIPNHDATFSTLSTKLNYYFDYGGFEALLGDVARGNIFGGLVFIKPFSAIENYWARSVSFGYTFVADRNAPTDVKYVKYYDYEAEDYAAGADERVPRIANDSKGRPIVADDEFLYMQGIDFEVKLYKDEKTDLKIFTDYSWFKTNIEKGGFTFGLLGRFNLDQNNQHAIRIQLEGRAHHDSYLPSFFDTFYDIERIEMMTNIFGRDNFQPDGRSKYYHLLHDSSDKFVGSFYGEISYSFKTWIALSLGYEQLRQSASLFAHLELPDLWIFKMMVTYYKRGFGKPSELFSDSKVSSLFRAVVRLQILPVLYINGYAGKHWSFWSADNPRGGDNLEGHYVSSWDLGADVEFGWEWGRAGKEKKKKPEKTDNPQEEKTTEQK